MKNKQTHILLAVFIAITVLPILAGFIYAALSAFGLAGYLGNGFTWMYWQQAFDMQVLPAIGFYSLAITCVVLFLATIIGMFVVLYFKEKTQSGVLSYLLYLPMAIPLIAAASLTLHFLGNAGLLARFAYLLNLIESPGDFPDMVQDRWSIGIVITHTIIAAAYFSILFSAIFKQNAIQAYMDAAHTLGAGKKQVIRKIVLPLVLNKALPSIILYGVFIFGSYEVPMLLGQQEPQMISVSIAQKFTRYNLADVPVAYALASMYTIVVVAVLFILFKKGKLIHEVE